MKINQHSFRVPNDDRQVETWIKNQHNLSTSLRALIHSVDPDHDYFTFSTPFTPSTPSDASPQASSIENQIQKMKGLLND